MCVVVKRELAATARRLALRLAGGRALCLGPTLFLCLPFALARLLGLGGGTLLPGGGATPPTITSPTDPSNQGGFQITSIALAPSPALQAAYFASCTVPAKADLQQYVVQFVATTSLGQKLEDVVIYNLKEKTDL